MLDILNKFQSFYLPLKPRFQMNRGTALNLSGNPFKQGQIIPL
nr:MAG TPA: hypothetical protein [Caudoviricetes sp.]